MCHCDCLFKQAATTLQRSEIDCANVHEAVQRGHVGCLKLLLPETQATRALFDEHRETPLHLIDHSLTAVCHELTAVLLAAPAIPVKAMLNAQDRSSNTALHHTVLTDSSSKGAAPASSTVCYTCVNALLAAGADPTLSDHHGRSLLSRLMEAAELCDDADVAQCIRLVKLMQLAGVDVDESCCLHEVAAQTDSAGKVQVLLACGAKPDTRNDQGWTAMHAAAAWLGTHSTGVGASNAAVIQLLFGVNYIELLNAATQDTERQTALHLAVQWPSNVERLLQLGADTGAVNASEHTALHTACAAPATANASESVRLLLAAGAATGLHCSQNDYYTEGGGWQPVHAAAMHFDAAAKFDSALDLLLKSGVSVDAATTEGCTAAWLVARYSTVVEDACDRLEALLSRGADLHHHTDKHGSLLHAAARNGSVDIMQWLLAKGLVLSNTSPAMRTSAGYTPLLCAAEAGHADMVQLLIKKKCSLTATDRNGSTALRLAVFGSVDSGACCALLIDAGSDLENLASGTK
jgi:ankyrin repeat protein